MLWKSGKTVDTAASDPGGLSTSAAYKAAGVKIFSLVSVLVLTAACFGPSLLIAPVAAQSQPRPNVVVIMTDDMRLRDLRVMEKTKALFSTGTTFRNHFVTTPLCCPSRATFLTGQYAHNHGVLTNKPPEGGFTALNHTNTLPVWLRAAGYYTSHIGKYLNGYPGDNPKTFVPPGWTDWQALIGFIYRMYDYNISDNGTIVRYDTAKQHYQTDVLANRAVATINQAARSGRPFFLKIAPVAPHRVASDAAGNDVGPQPAPRHLGAFASEPLPKPPSFNESDVSDKPRFIRNQPLRTPSEIQGITTSYRARLASLLAVDDLVARVANALSRAGELDHTVLIFTSDNGYHLGEHRLRFKDSVYDEAVRMPLLIRGPGFSKGAITDHVVGNIDLAPTIVDLANARPGLPMDGQSLVPLASDPKRAPARTLLIESQDYQAVRNQSFLYAEHKNGEQELYDMRQGHPNYDPFQLISRHASPAYAQARSQLATKLIRLRTCAGANCRVR